MNGYNRESTRQGRSNAIGRGISKGKRRWWRMLGIQGRPVEGDGLGGEGHTSHSQRSNRSHLGGVFIGGNSGLD